MVQLYTMLWISAIFFGIIGAMRGWNREIVSTAGIILALFTLFQLDPLLRGVFLASVPREQTFFVQVGLFAAIIYFAYQSRTIVDRSGPDNPNRTQNMVLGVVLGALNGYLIWGAIWYFLDINEYPFSPLVTAPPAGSVSEQALNAIPLVLLGGGAAASGELLTIVVIVLFLLVLFII
ncbi:MAG: hypothetical protein DWB42_12365 [Chloroflexi bacterium]|nr:hypothetical protein [Chloroflexota bacterium]MDL1884620.1 hypothetical protein [Anaerolineae bacterium CFX8]